MSLPLAAPAQSDSALVIAIVMIAVLVPVAAVLIGYAYRHRFKPVERQIGEFTAQFDGTRVVHFQPYFWSFDANTARGIAQQRGYVEFDPSPNLPRAGAHRVVLAFQPQYPRP